MAFGNGKRRCGMCGKHRDCYRVDGIWACAGCKGTLSSCDSYGADRNASGRQTNAGKVVQTNASAWSQKMIAAKRARRG